MATPGKCQFIFSLPYENNLTEGNIMEIKALQQGIKDNLFNKNGKLNGVRFRKNGNGIYKNNIEVYYDIFKKTDFLFEKYIEVTLPQRIGHILNEIFEIQGCLYCNRFPVDFNSSKAQYYNHCSKSCSSSSKEVQKKYKNTNIERLGVKHPLQCEEIKENIAQTNSERRGVRNPFQCEEVKESIAQINLERLGVKHPLQCEEVKAKSRKTCYENNGVLYPMQSKEVNKKRKQTNLERRGVRHSFQCEEVKAKSRKTCYENNGVLYPMQSKDAQKKSRQTSNKNFGVSHPAQDPMIAEKILCNSLKFKDYQLPSGNGLKLQGYEPIALDELLVNYNENEILSKKSDMPEIGYISEDDNKHRYFPDFYIPKDNLVIEVKSEGIINKQYDKNILKKEATENLGYTFQFMIY